MAIELFPLQQHKWYKGGNGDGARRNRPALLASSS
jgi:hypothetical protein